MNIMTRCFHVRCTLHTLLVPRCAMSSHACHTSHRCPTRFVSLRRLHAPALLDASVRSASQCCTSLHAAASMSLHHEPGTSLSPPRRHDFSAFSSLSKTLKFSLTQKEPLLLDYIDSHFASRNQLILSHRFRPSSPRDFFSPHTVVCIF